MPTYEYRCSECGQTLSLDMTISVHDQFNAHLVKHEPPTVGGETVGCPDCGSTELEQQFGRFYAKTTRKS